jgi:two-component system phosphate regulon sensor histidine kinase PhoR
MKLGVRGKLFAASLAIMVVVGLASGLYLESALESWLHARIEGELSRSASAARDLVVVAGVEPTLEAVDPLADRLGASTQSRVTIIADSGVVLGDSELDGEALRKVERHGDRPEVREAIATGRGVGRRYSDTVDTEMVYVAVPYATPAGSGVVRASVPLAEVHEAVSNLRLVLVLAGLVGIALAIFMSGLASQLATRAIRRLVKSARAVARGEGSRQIPVASSDELGRLAGSFNRVVEELDLTVTVLTDERDHLETILESIRDGLISLDPENRVTRANRAALDLLDLDETPFDQPLVESVRVPALVELVSAEVSDPDATVEFELPGNQQIRAHVAPLRTGGRVLVLRDVTRTRRLEQIRRDFVANVSHELRTPVSVIRANVETLVSGAIDDTEHAHQFLDAVHRNADRLSQLISDLLDLSRIEAGEYHIDMEPVRIAPLVIRVVGNLMSAASAKGIELSVDAPPDLEGVADARALEQCVFNLIDNAVKYSNGGVVTIRAERRGGEVRVEVVDQGPGIEARHRERIFERFYRADPGRSREMGGTGLGLSIVRHLIEAMNGAVGFQPQASRGSLFWITLGAPDADVARSQPAPVARPVARKPKPRPASLKDLAPALEPRGEGGPKTEYDEQQQVLREQLLVMAGRVEEMIKLSVRALVERDPELARETIRSDNLVNRAELETDEMCLVLLAKYQPVTRDLLFVPLVLKMVTDLERIGDLAVNICERAIDLAAAPQLARWDHILEMAEIAQSMVKDAIDAFVDSDVDKAESVLTRDEQVDELFTRVFRDVLVLMMSDASTVERGIHVQSVAKWLERIADHSTNLAEQVIFMVKGKDVRHAGKLGLK